MEAKTGSDEERALDINACSGPASPVQLGVEVLTKGLRLLTVGHKQPEVMTPDAITT